MRVTTRVTTGREENTREELAKRSCYYRSGIKRLFYYSDLKNFIAVDTYRYGNLINRII